MLLVYLGAVADVFIYSQWERKGKITDVYFYVCCEMGPEANVLHSALRISS